MTTSLWYFSFTWPKLMKHTLQFQIFQHPFTTCFISLKRHRNKPQGLLT